MYTLKATSHQVVGLDIVASRFTDIVVSVADRQAVRRAMTGVDAVLHTATLHKPHVATHARQEFIDTNITGTLNLLETAVECGVRSFVFTSSTSVFGDALVPLPDEPAAWIDESVRPVAKNIYGATKAAAEDLCRLFHRNHGLSCVVLRTSRFFPEPDDMKDVRETYADANVKANEYLYRRVSLEDAVSAHLCAMERAAHIGFGMYIVSATSPFVIDDLAQLRRDAPSVVKARVPTYEAQYARLGWRMFPSIDRVYDNKRARLELGWQPSLDFVGVVERLREDKEVRGSLALLIGTKGYHSATFHNGPYPVETSRH
jgi:UDP-glucose 4-epimerase